MNDKEYIINIRKENPKHWVSMIKRSRVDLFNDVLEYNERNGISCQNNSQRFYNYCYSVTHQPICEYTNRPLKFINTDWKYRSYGARGISTPDMINKRSTTRKANKSDYSISVKIKKIKNNLNDYEEKTITDLHRDIKANISTTNAGGIISNLVDKHPELIANCIRFQLKYEIHKLSEAIYCVYHNITPKTCELTGSRAKFISFKDGYAKYTTDANNQELISKKRKLTIKNNILLAAKQNPNLTDKDLRIMIKRIFEDEYDALKQNPKQYIQSKYPELIPQINNRTSYILTDNFAEKLYHIYHDLHTQPLNKFKKPAIFETFLNGYRLCENAYICSDIEIAIREYIESIYDGDIVLNDIMALGNRQEIDIYLPEFKIGIEVNGEYYHSDEFKPKTYHLDKTNAGIASGIRIIHIWATEWTDKPLIVQSMIRNMLGLNQRSIYARKCIIKEIDSKTKNQFLNENHLQGKDNSKYKFGAYFGDELVAVMTFGSRQISKVTKFELIRYCSKLNTNVIGIASKLFKRFIDTYDIDEVFTYADNRWSIGGLYANLGFSFQHTSACSYYYFKNRKLYHRTSFQKHKLKGKLINFDPELTEKDNMKNNGYYRVWDCGQHVFKWSR